LGKNLFLKVEHIMHFGTDMPRVSAETPMNEVVLEMTAKKLGMTMVFNAEENLVGVITDGDLRRLFKSPSHNTLEILSIPAKSVMNKNPKTIDKKALAGEALHMMEASAITSLVAVDSTTGYPVGILHLHDLLKRGAF